MKRKSIQEVTVNALVKRINRRLGVDEMQLRRPRRYDASIGSYYIHGLARNLVVETHVDPEELARRLGVMATWERVADAP